MRTRWRLGLPLAAISLSLAAASPALAVTQRFPNLTTDRPSNLRLTTDVVDGVLYHVLRFSNTVRNVGDGPLELRGDTAESRNGLMPAVQWIARDLSLPVALPGDEENVGDFEYHAPHGHYHFNDFAQYELLTYPGRERVGPGISEKATFCLMDNSSPGPPAVPTYTNCGIINGKLRQGISVGWGDTYGSWLPGQYVKIGPQPLGDGAYVLRSTADPDNRLFESSGKDNSAREQGDNSAEVVFDVVNGQVKVR